MTVLARHLLSVDVLAAIEIENAQRLRQAERDDERAKKITRERETMVLAQEKRLRERST